LSQAKVRSTTQRRGSTTNPFVIIHPADIQDRDGGILLFATLFAMYPFLEKALCRWWLPGAGLSKGLGEDLASARN